MADLQIVREAISIHAPLERCWALSLRVELVRKTIGMTPSEGGVTSGAVAEGSRVEWKGWKFFWPTRHTSLIGGFDPPHDDRQGGRTDRCAFFQDTQERGRFEVFQHEHSFTEDPGSRPPCTVLKDKVSFSLPWENAVGDLVARHVMKPYVRRLMRRRFRLLQELAEGDGWREWIESQTPDVPQS